MNPFHPSRILIFIFFPLVFFALLTLFLAVHEVNLEMKGGDNRVIFSSVPGRHMPGLAESQDLLPGKMMITTHALVPIVTALWQRYLLQAFPFSVALSCLLLMGWRSNWIIAAHLYAGMRRGGFSVMYQPVFEAQGGCCIGAEALLRWTRINGTSIPPDEFIAAAERAGMIISLTRHLFALIARDIETWPIQNNLRLSINLAPIQLIDPHFYTDIVELQTELAKKGFRIMLEITERSDISDISETVLALERLRERGIMVAIDDFGTGYSALSWVQQLPLDCLKIDRVFVESVKENRGDTRVLEAIIHLARRMNLTMVAEGVSTEKQRSWLVRRGVHYLQGYLLAHPLRSRAFAAWLSGVPE
ncbi:MULTISPECIES: EAL domain-containing protein [Erwinia]|uniref:EAL domain-containing protein n=1 Tax=Erwinia TaxID=551 RepID=UPI0014896214|nr:EAL domain-containing protein [Erwinia sp. JH02]NNS06687.1 EAL domain-containing protein [Erwinia sp. JH02]